MSTEDSPPDHSAGRSARLALAQSVAPAPRRPHRRRVLLDSRCRTAGPCIPDGAIDFAYPAPQPEPFTTIAWRMAHVIVGVLAVRAHSHFDGPPADYESWNYATDADTALRQLDDAYANWMSGVRAPVGRRPGSADRTRRGPLRRQADDRSGPAHQPRSHSPRRRDRPAPRPLRAQHRYHTDTREN